MQFYIIFALTLVSVLAVPHYHSKNYKFSYSVDDPHTGDKKSHYEIGYDKEVVGGYILKEPDGTTRIVKYLVGPHSGFNAIVQRKGLASHPGKYGELGGTSYVGITHYG